MRDPSPTLPLGHPRTSAVSGRRREPIQHLPEQPPMQVPLGQEQPVLASVPVDPSDRLHQPVLQVCQRPALDSMRQSQPPPQVAQVIGQAYFVRPEAMARQPCPMPRLLAFFDPLLGRPALVVDRTTERLGRVTLVTMTPGHGNNSPWLVALHPRSRPAGADAASVSADQGLAHVDPPHLAGDSRHDALAIGAAALWSSFAPPFSPFCETSS